MTGGMCVGSNGAAQAERASSKRGREGQGGAPRPRRREAEGEGPRTSGRGGGLRSVPRKGAGVWAVGGLGNKKPQATFCRVTPSEGQTSQ